MGHLQDAIKYAKDITQGVIPGCIYVRQACQRMLNDMDRQGTEGFPYHLDEEAANKICDFIELLPHIKGVWARQKQLLVLEPWQKFILCNVFGWLDEAGNRRFKTSYEEVPRKNAKSTVTSGVGLYLMTVDGEPGAEIYSAATTEDQAKIVWKVAKAMIQRCEGIQREFGVAWNAKSIFRHDDESLFKPLTRDQGGNLDGLNIHGGLIDELHAHKTRDLFDVIETGTGSRTSPLIWLITTAGSNQAGICYEQRSYSIKILSGAVEDEEYFAIIYTIDKDDDWTDPAVWAKANPNWEVSVNPDDMRRKARKAMQIASAQANFLTKHLNVWTNADTLWLDQNAWAKCGDPTLNIEDFWGADCYISLDLATTTDLVSKAYLFMEGGEEDEDDEEYYLFVRHYVPEEVVENSQNSQYKGWAIDGRFIVTDGNVTDFATIEEDVKTDAGDFHVLNCGYDPWQGQYLSNNLSDEGLVMVEVRQNVQTISPAMKWFEALVLSGRLHHEDCPVLNWMISNTVCHTDVKENVYPRKEMPQNKIDGVVASLMTITQVLPSADEENTSAYDDEETGV